MKDDLENWIDNAFDSLKGSKKASPDPGLLARIEAGLGTQEAKTIPVVQWRLAAVAAAVLLLLNIWAVSGYISSDQTRSDGSGWEAESDRQLISNYRLYDL